MDRSTYMKMLYKYDDEYKAKVKKQAHDYYWSHKEKMKKLSNDNYYLKKYGCTRQEYCERSSGEALGDRA